ncbi:MAG: YkgJ family cysteine cluster protein [Gammaproteobacteria bacterium]|nr:YkgJ family cysteine cluster protein [Gammaproteobacteria bacterium]
MAQKSIKITAENKCGLCKASTCCTYITQPFDTPRSKQDFDYLLWQISHQGIQCFKDPEGWYYRIVSRCQHLLDNGDCGIYDKRPQICREHTNDWCDYDIDVRDEYELFFDSYESLDAYCRKRFKKWDQRFQEWEA